MACKAARAISIGAQRNAVFVIFGLVGLGFATWIARIPAVRDDLQLSTAEMAALLFGLAAGSIVGLVVAPNILGRVGSRRAMFHMFSGFAASLIAIGISVDLFASSMMAFAVLACFGFFFSAIDVLMNVEGRAWNAPSARPCYH